MIVSYSQRMRNPVFILLAMFASLCLAGNAVYKTIDENGNVIFTDQPSESAEKIQLDELQTIENPNPARLKPLPRKQQSSAVDKDYYQAFSILSPTIGESYRNNAGNFTISLSLQPALRPSHRVVIKLDGKEVANGKSLSKSLTSQDRGTHTISAQVVDASGKTMISTSGSFTLQRVSR